MDWFAPPRAFAPLVRPAAALLLCAGAVTAVTASVDGWRRSNADFVSMPQYRVESLTADYVLGRDADGSARLDATEQVRLTFLAPDAAADGPPEHAFVRVLPTTLDGLRRPVQVLGVEDASGRVLPWTMTGEGDSLHLRVVDSEATPGQPATYVIHYAADGVVRSDGGGQVLEWGVTGRDWSRSIPEVSARLTTTADLRGVLDVAGGAAEPLTVSATDVSPHEDVQLRAGIHGTRFTDPQADPAHERARATVLWIGMSALALAGAAMALAAARHHRGQAGQVTVARSVIPFDLSPALAGSLLGRPGRGVVGQLLDAAVRGYVRLRPGHQDVLVETFACPPQLTPEAKVALSVLAPSGPGRPQSVRARLDGVDDDALTLVRDAAIRAGLVTRPDVARGDRLLIVGAAAAAVGIPWLAHSSGVGFAVGAASLAMVLGAAGVAHGVLHAWRSWTPRGVEALGRLEGLRSYLTSPQAERMTVLQEAIGGDRVISAAEEADVHGRLLPYAVVLGVEDAWLGASDATRVTAPAWLPEGRLRDILRAMTAGDLAERLDRRVPTTPGAPHALTPMGPAAPVPLVAPDGAGGA